MLQNHCKGIYFFPNNQKKTHKMSHRCSIFLIWFGYGIQKWQWNGKWRKTCHITLSIIVPEFSFGIISSPTSLDIYFYFKSTLGVYHAPKDFLKTLLVTEVPYIGYQTDYICYYWNCPKKGVGAARNYATSTIRITALTITFHARWMVLVELAFLLKRQIYTPLLLILKTIIM